MNPVISLYSTWWVKPGEEESLKHAIKKFVPEIKANEPGTLMYFVHFPRYDFPAKEEGKNQIISEPMVRPGTVVFMEKYASWDAFKDHLHGEYFTSFVKMNKSKFVLGDNGEPFVQVVFLEEDDGFVREEINRPTKKENKKR